MNKRGQGLSTNVIILIILGVVVLSVLIIGFTAGWAKIAPWISTNNVDTIVTSCEVACSTQSVYDFCTAPREVKVSGENPVKGTCNSLTTSNVAFGIGNCPAISCGGNNS